MTGRISCALTEAIKNCNGQTKQDSERSGRCWHTFMSKVQPDASRLRVSSYSCSTALHQHGMPSHD